MSHIKRLTAKRLTYTSVGLLILSLFFVLSVVSAQTDTGNWENAPDFTTASNNGYTWMLAPEQSDPQPGDLVWVIPVENNTPVNQSPDNTWIYAVLGISVIFFILTVGCLIKAKGIKLRKSAVAITTVCLITFSMFTVFPMASADQTAKTGYKLSTPQGPDYYVCNYTDGSIGVIRGSDWANLMTYMGTSGGVPITPIWAGYTNNASAVWENIYDTISYGIVYSKEVAPSITTGGLTAWQASIPDKVEVEISYQGNMYKFANPSNTAGSPYTVSVGAKMLSGNYTAQDSAGRILWSSNNATYVMNSVSMIENQTVYVKDGIYRDMKTVFVANGTKMIGESNNTRLIWASGQTMYAYNYGMFEPIGLRYSDVSYANQSRTHDIWIEGFNIDMNFNGILSPTDYFVGMWIANVTGVTLLNNYIANSMGDGMGVQNCTDGYVAFNTVENNHAKNAFYCEGRLNSHAANYNIEFHKNLAKYTIDIQTTETITGFEISCAKNIRHTGNTVQGYAGNHSLVAYGFNLETYAETSQNLIIDGNTINYALIGINIGDLTKSVITKNTINYTDSYGVFMTNYVNDTIFSENNLIGCAKVSNSQPVYFGTKSNNNQFIDNIIDGTQLASSKLILLNGNNNTISRNTLKNAYYLIRVDQTATGNIIEDNKLFDFTYANGIPIYFTSGTLTVLNYVRSNIGYPAAANISQPIYNGYIVDDSFGNAQMANNTVYTNNQSPKTIYVPITDAATTYTIQVNGITVFSGSGSVTTVTVNLRTGATFKEVATGGSATFAVPVVQQNIA